MTIAYAKELLGIQLTEGLDKLQQQYHALLKKYHPDQYQEQTEFYNIITGRINQAYHLLVTEMKKAEAQNADHLAGSLDVDTQPAHTTAVDGQGIKSDEQDTETILYGKSPMHPRIIDTTYRPYIESTQNIICHYYSYNLSNVHLRDEGSTRTHFKVVQNQCTALLRKFKQHIMHNQDHDSDAYYYLQFCQAFFDSIQSELRVRTTLNKTAYKLLKVYRDCAQILDSAIEQRYCKKHPISANVSIENVLLVQHNFKTLAKEDEHFGFKNIAIIKHNLAEKFSETFYWQYNTKYDIR